MPLRLLPAILLLLPGPATARASAEEPPLREIQRRLQAMGYYHGKVDGVPGSQTAAAIRRYQLAKNLRVTGEMNPQTAASLGFAPAASPAPGAQNNSIFAGGPLARASESARRDAIRQAQAYLRRQGYEVGPVDGVAGPQTLAALRAWQVRAGFPFPGRLDAATLSRMGIRAGD